MSPRYAHITGWGMAVPEEILTGRDIVTQDQTFEDRATGEIITVPGLRATPISVYNPGNWKLGEF